MRQSDFQHWFEGLRSFAWLFQWTCFVVVSFPWCTLSPWYRLCKRLSLSRSKIIVLALISCLFVKWYLFDDFGNFHSFLLLHLLASCVSDYVAQVWSYLMKFRNSCDLILLVTKPYQCLSPHVSNNYRLFCTFYRRTHWYAAPCRVQPLRKTFASCNITQTTILAAHLSKWLLYHYLTGQVI